MTDRTPDQWREKIAQDERVSNAVWLTITIFIFIIGALGL